MESSRRGTPHCSCARDGDVFFFLFLPIPNSEGDMCPRRRRLFSYFPSAVSYQLIIIPSLSRLHPTCKTSTPSRPRAKYQFFVPSPTASPELITIHKLYQANLIYSVCSRLLLRANNSNKAPLIVCLFAFAGPPSTTSIHHPFYFLLSSNDEGKPEERKAVGLSGQQILNLFPSLMRRMTSSPT